MRKGKSVDLFKIMMRQSFLAVMLLAFILFVAGCGSSGSSGTSSTYRAEVQRTSYNVPHIIAENYKGLGYGLGYAYAQDNICLLANTIITARGERSRFFGPTLTDPSYPRTTWNNLNSDFWHKFYFDDSRLREGLDAMPVQVRDMAKGFAAGYNRYLQEAGPAGLPSECRNAPWVRPITEDDLQRLHWLGSTMAGGQAWGAAMLLAQPPVPRAELPKINLEDFDREIDRLRMTDGDTPGSNVIAIGRDGSANGKGMLLGNPHFPWIGRERFYQMHLTIPGEIDVMGASLHGSTFVNIGFNNSVAWSHTVSTAQRYTLYELKLQAGTPTSYEYDGLFRPMTTRTVTVDILNPDSSLTQQQRTFYSTHFGPAVVNPAIGLNWTTTRAFAMRDANIDNLRMQEQWFKINRAKSVAEVRSALSSVLGIPWVNTAAADAAGNTFYGDVGAIPYVTAAKRTACTTATGAGLFAAAGIILLDGSRSACEWDVDPGTPRPGLMPPGQLPMLERTDYVQNSNDSYWLTHPAQPLTGFSPVIGNEVTVALNLRTRVGISQAQARLAGTDGRFGNRFDLPILQELTFANRVHAAEITLIDLPKVCEVTSALVGGVSVDYSTACTILTSWDRKANIESVGMAVFREFWNVARNTANLYKVPYSAADPVNTPRGLNVADAPVLSALRVAMATAVSRLQTNGIALDSPWGLVHYDTRGGVRIPIHGGTTPEGVYNQIVSASLSAQGYTPITTGSSYIQTVTFDGTGPVAEGMLTYSQSSSPTSAYYSDQTTRYSNKIWSRLPFRQAEIRADAAFRSQSIQE